MKKMLFNNDVNESWTPEANVICNEFTLLIEPIIKKYIADGYSVREIEYILTRSVGDICIEQLVFGDLQ